jgi:hypothetical protein
MNYRKGTVLHRSILAIIALLFASLACKAPTPFGPTATLTSTVTSTPTVTRTPTMTPTQTPVPTPMVLDIDDFWKLPSSPKGECEPLALTQNAQMQVLQCFFEEDQVGVLYESLKEGAAELFMPIYGVEEWESGNNMSGQYFITPVPESNTTIMRFILDDHDYVITVVSDTMDQEELYKWALDNILILKPGLSL